MRHKGISHVGLSTLDLDKTRKFYEGVLGFRPVVADTITIEEGGRIRHLFFDVGRDQLIAFMEADGVRDVPAEYDTSINRGLGVPAAFYHFAFEAGSEAALAACCAEARKVPAPTIIAARNFTERLKETFGSFKFPSGKTVFAGKTGLALNPFRRVYAACGNGIFAASWLTDCRGGNRTR